MWRWDGTCTGYAIDKSVGNAISCQPTDEARGLDQPGIGGAIPFSSTSTRVPETQVGYRKQQAVGAVRPDQPME